MLTDSVGNVPEEMQIGHYPIKNRKWGEQNIKAAQFLCAHMSDNTWCSHSKHTYKWISWTCSVNGKALFNTFAVSWWLDLQLLHWLSHLHKNRTHNTIYELLMYDGLLYISVENKDNSWFTWVDIYIKTSHSSSLQMQAHLKCLKSYKFAVCIFHIAYMLLLNLHTAGSVGWLVHNLIKDTSEAYILTFIYLYRDGKIVSQKRKEKKEEKTFTLFKHCSPDPPWIHRFPCTVQLYSLLLNHTEHSLINYIEV